MKTAEGDIEISEVHVDAKTVQLRSDIAVDAERNLKESMEIWRSVLDDHSEILQTTQQTCQVEVCESFSVPLL